MPWRGEESCIARIQNEIWPTTVEVGHTLASVKPPGQMSVRTHLCTGCGVVLDRDQNAALNILSKALEGTVGHMGTHGREP